MKFKIFLALSMMAIANIVSAEPAIIDIAYSNMPGAKFFYKWNGPLTGTPYCNMTNNLCSFHLNLTHPNHVGGGAIGIATNDGDFCIISFLTEATGAIGEVYNVQAICSSDYTTLMVSNFAVNHWQILIQPTSLSVHKNKN